MKKENPEKSNRSKRVLKLVDNIIAHAEEKIATGNCMEVLGIVIVLQKIATILKSLDDLKGDEKVVAQKLSDEDKEIIERYVKKRSLANEVTEDE